MDKFLKENRVPSIHEGNKNEPLMPIGKRWNGYGQVVLGASLETACETPAHLSAAISAFPISSPFVLTYRPDKDKVFVVLRQTADKAAALEGAFLAHLWLCRIHETVGDKERRCMSALPLHMAGCCCEAVDMAGQEALAYVQKRRKVLWHQFSEEAIGHGWNMKGTMLAIGDTRLLPLP